MSGLLARLVAERIRACPYVAALSAAPFGTAVESDERGSP